VRTSRAEEQGAKRCCRPSGTSRWINVVVGWEDFLLGSNSSSRR